MAGYGTDNGLGAWLEANGYELSGEVDHAVLRQRGSAYVDGLYEPRFGGARTGGLAQDRAWPRTGATFGPGRLAIDSALVPNQVVEASYVAAYQADTRPGGLTPVVVPGEIVKRQKVDVLEKEFFAPGGDAKAAVTPIFPEIEGLLAPLLEPETAGGIFFASVG